MRVSSFRLHTLFRVIVYVTILDDRRLPVSIFETNDFTMWFDPLGWSIDEDA